MNRAAIVVIAAVLGLGVPGPEVRAQSTGLDYGRSAVGFRVERLTAGDGLLPGTIQLWYPAAAPCASVLTYGDYLRGDAQQPGHDVGAELRQGWSMTSAALTDEQWSRVLSTPMRACRDAAPPPARAPLIVAIQQPGGWPVAAEYFASHGYAFATVSRPLASPPRGELVDRVTTRKQGFVHDLDAALTQLSARPEIDGIRTGAVGQNHALLMLAMQRPDVRAVALQDSFFQEGVDAASNRQTGLWRPERFQAALLHAISHERVKDEAAWDAFRASAPGPWIRLVIGPPHTGHNDVTADGYLIRSRGPVTSAPAGTLIGVFEGLLRAQRAFFDRYVAGRADAPAIEAVTDRRLFSVERR